MDINKFLIEAAEKDASDVHITVGIPPTMRLYGKLKPMADFLITDEHCAEIFDKILTEGQKKYLQSFPRESEHVAFSNFWCLVWKLEQ